MFLKSLEIRGFKSFADKTELKFDKGITAVVGPNGSGKSNISDAVRWVLGEQSVKTLRGSKMEDVIFTGTQYRKPIGFAQVSLTLDNSEQELPLEFMDVKISRRIFRSGESEYLINNSQCRLKDVVQLFMDTGIGKEGYSLIGQGKIDAILSGKPEERRNLLEEAAGIVKFKSRKTEAERKLKNTNENLIRINDIIFTYEERIGPLEKEKDKALKFVSLSNELKEKEIELIVSNLKSINNDISNRKIEIESLIKKSEEYKIELNKKRNLIKNEKNKLDEAENTNSEDQKLYLNKKEIIAKAKADIDLLEERINNLEEALRKNNIDLTRHKEKICHLNDQKENLEADLTNKQEILNKHNEEIVKVEENIKAINIELEEKRKKLNEIKNKELDNIKKIAEMKNKSVSIEGEIKNIKFNLENSRVSMGNFKNSLKINSATKVDLEKQFKKVKEDIKDLEISIESNIKEKEKLTSDIFNLKKQLSIIVTSINKLDANKEMLKKLEKQYEGYNISVKRIMENIEEGHINVDRKKCAVLGEILKTFKGYEMAIEVSLGAAISNIITEDENTAKLLINHLKQNRLGRATFLPLSIIKGKKLSLDDSIKSIKGYLGIASELVNYDNKYENIVNYSLGKTIIAADIDSAIIIAKKANYRYRIVTLQGEIINSGGAMTGGSIHHRNMGIISRKSEIYSLDEKIKETLKNKNNLDEKIKQLEEILERLNTERKCFTDEIYTKNIKNVDLKGKINNINHIVSDLENNINNENIKIEEYLIKIKGLEEELVKSGKNAKELSFIDEEEKQISIVLEKDINALTNKIQNIKDESTESKIKKAQLKEYIDNKIIELSKCEKDSEEVLEKILEIKNYIKQSKEHINKSKENISKNKEIIVNEQSYIYSLEEKYRNFQVLKGKLKQGILKLENEMEVSTIEASKLDEEIHRKEILYTKQESEQEVYYEKLQDEYNTSYKEVCNKFSIITNLDVHKSKISSLKGKIASLGIVNVNAVEEFRELSEKYKFITSEKEDLEKAKEELLNVIDEMTSKMKVVFRQNFNTLNKYFDETFKELFKGGSAKLILDEGDELNGNIEINVQPPGKKVQNINLMSGGEKVLSAIALLFGILKMKPTPFCILDEIEAALDDANVNRYSDFLRKFSKDIQFIVITHRKGTMASADVMYGVTMEEKGISKVVSVDLSK